MFLMNTLRNGCKKNGINLTMLLAFLSLFFFSSYYYPMRADDYWYNYTILSDDNGIYSFSDRLISNWRDVGASVFRHHQVGCFNGRFANYVFIAIEFFARGHAWVLPALNLLALILSLLLIQLYCFRKISWAGTVLTISVSTLFLPGIAVLLWRAGAVNYLWGTPLFISLLMIVERCLYKDIQSKKLWIVTLFICLLGGWWHEALGIPFLGAMFFLFILRLGKCRPCYVFCGVILMIGSLLAIQGGTIERTGVVSSFPLQFFIKGLIKKSVDGIIHYLILPCAACCIALCVGRFSLLRSFKDNLLLPLGVLYAVLSVTFAHKGGWEGGYFYPLLLILLCTLRSLEKIPLLMYRWLVWGAWFLVCVCMLITCLFCHRLYQTYNRILDECDTGLKGNVFVFQEDKNSRFHSLDWSIPMNSLRGVYRCFGPLLGKPAFFVVVNRNIEEREFYSSGNWIESSMAGVSFCMHGKTLLVRVDRSLYEVSGCSSVLTTSGGKRSSWVPVVLERNPIDLFRCTESDKLYSIDCDDFNFYLIFPNIGECSTVSLSLIANFEEKMVDIRLCK